MYNLQRYSSALLVFVFYIKTLTGFPYAVQPVPVTQPQLVPISESNISVDSIPVEARSLNVSDGNPSLRSLNAQTINNISVEVPLVVRSLQLNSADPPQQEDVASKNGFAAIERTSGGSPSQDSIQQRVNSAQINANLSIQGIAPIPRTELEDLTSNVSSVDERSLNGSSSSSAAVATRAANDAQVEARSLNLNPAPEATNVSSSSSFVPWFLKNFDLRQKRGEGDSPEDSALTVSDSSEHASPVNNTSQPAVRSSLEQASPVNNDEVAVSPPVNLNVAPKDANVESVSELAR